MRLLRDPLTHFLAIGAVLFAAAHALRPPPLDEKTITVDRTGLLEFIQFRSNAFEAKSAAALLDGMTADERKALVDDFVREEVLYREAKALGLDEGDYVIKRRLVQKFEFATDAAIGDDPPSQAEIENWYAAHKSDYAIEPAATFAHVFFDAAKRGPAAQTDAAAAVETLNAAHAPFEAAVGKGDRFPFQTNYVDRSFDEVAAQLGETAAREIFRDGPFGVWRGPISSEYGAHAIFVKSVAAERTPPLGKIRDRVAEDAALARREKTRGAIVDGAIKQYRIVVAPAATRGAPQ